MFRGGWFHLACDAEQAALRTISTIDGYGAVRGSWTPIGEEMRDRGYGGRQPEVAVQAVLGPRLLGAMPRNTLFLLRTYDAPGGAEVLLQSWISNPLKIRKTDTFLALVLRDMGPLNPVEIGRPEDARL